MEQLSLEAFVRSLAVNRGRPVSVLLGAGASISSGMPSAERCVWEWKQDIFATNNPLLRQTVGELSLAGTKRRIQGWLDARGTYPAAGAVEEYSFYASACYPTPNDRRQFFHRHVEAARPHTGYSLLPLLARERLITTVWTTNFDDLVSRACAAANVTCISVGIDSAIRVLRPPVSGEIRVVSLHGDFRYDALKNTTQELRTQEAALEVGLLTELSTHDLVVVGYSGRDESLMSVLQTAFARDGRTRLYWCGLGEGVPESVSALFEVAAQHGREAYFVPTQGFDDLVTRLCLRQLEGELLEEARSIVSVRRDATANRTPFASPSLARVSSLIKSNAYPLRFPAQATKAALRFPAGVSHRDWIAESVGIGRGVAVSIDDSVLALADPEDLLSAFRTELVGTPTAVAFSDAEVMRDRRLQSLLRRGLVQSAASFLSVETDGTRRIWEPLHYSERTNNGATFRIHRAAAFNLQILGAATHVVLTPEVAAKTMAGELAESDVSKVLRNEVYGFQHNHVFNADLKHWTDRLNGQEIPAPGGSSFWLSRAPSFAGVVKAGRPPLSDELRRYARQTGVVVPDATLVFSSATDGVEARHVSPLLGLTQNRPWDVQLTSSGLAPRVDVAVVCPRSDAARIRGFLTGLHSLARPTNQDRDYLQDFPGFAEAFRLPLSLPNPGETTWVDLDGELRGPPLAAGKALAERICRALDRLRALRPGAVVIVYVPSEWDLAESYHSEEEQFDLHHVVKAYAARQGQATQFIRERTVISTQPCRVRWWLSLALYAKSLRTPWRLDCLDNETAFVGIGYSVDSLAERGNRILLGCSHLYSARGEGLQFRLGRIENPIIRHKNPFMSEDDARRTGETIRQLFFDARMTLPTRVVVHKRTYFSAEEQRGFLQGLGGVDNVELIEVAIEESLRYLASKIVLRRIEGRPPRSEPVIDQYPVERGTVLVQDEDTALVWVHGSAPSAQNPAYRYYQGKRRIPAPLRVRRYMGHSDITQVATEILGLSKMDWNSFDYYSKLPATLVSASAIARVGTYLAGFGYAPYDYRLLI
jgi:hypothetical protein